VPEDGVDVVGAEDPPEDDEGAGAEAVGEADDPVGLWGSLDGPPPHDAQSSVASTIAADLMAVPPFARTLRRSQGTQAVCRTGRQREVFRRQRQRASDSRVESSSGTTRASERDFSGVSRAGMQ
jgi:hypothetical protein